MSSDGVQKSAILLMSLGEDDAAEVFKYLGPREVQKIGSAMAALKSLNRDEISNVLDDFCAQASEKTSVGSSSTDYIKQVLRKALGDDRAANLIDRILQGGDTSGIEGLKWMDSAAVAELIKNEHPQIVATILVHLDRDQASEILLHFSERLRNDALLRIATLDGIQPAALRELNDVLTKLLSGTDNIKKAPMGGVRTAAEILNFMPATHENAVIEGVKTFDSDLAQKILDQMFTWDNVMEIDDRGIQVLLREVPSEGLILALKGSTQDFRDKIFKNMSTRAAETLKEDLEAKGMVRVSEVEAQQKEILKIVRRLGEEGEIQLGGKAEEAFV
ncbi:MAG: flagellar motor switch protein FliG [Betaproteobacteria bacterium]|jgi:flagellar motor switch protein FliG|nr:flagellar motor switch protein FliG [Betaproteobacteria bacterium]